MSNTPISRDKALDIQSELLDVFRKHDLSVSVGITEKGVSIGSQDERVEAYWIGEVKAY